MILLDALFVNNGGGKVLLDYFIVSAEKQKLDIFYLLDERIKDTTPNITNKKHLVFMEASLIARGSFYRKNRDKFTAVICFGNLPPNIRLKAKVFTYFHQKLFIQIPTHFSLKQKIVYRIKMEVLRLFKKNTDFWLVQSEEVKYGLKNKYKLKENSILIKPFYPPLNYSKDVVREKNSFIYVSNPSDHKNHHRLIEAFDIFYKKYKTGKLILTVDNQYLEVCELIETKKCQGINIENIGFVDRKILGDIYKATEYLVFPSLEESFGLGIVEAIESECKVLGADLPYMHVVCEASYLFDPLTIESIVKAFERTQNMPVLNESKSLVSDEIKDIIKLLQ